VRRSGIRHLGGDAKNDTSGSKGARRDKNNLLGGSPESKKRRVEGTGEKEWKKPKLSDLKKGEDGSREKRKEIRHGESAGCLEKEKKTKEMHVAALPSSWGQRLSRYV